MGAESTNPYERLERLFHEPNRLAIMSAVCGAPEGLTFTEIKEICDLTDGNLSRHLKVLDEAGAVQITKMFVDNKPRTTVIVSNDGLESFVGYLRALEDVLKSAEQSLGPARTRLNDPGALGI